MIVNGTPSSHCIGLATVILCIPFATSVSYVAQKHGNSAHASVEVSGSGPLQWSVSQQAAALQHSEPLVRRDAKPIDRSSNSQSHRRQQLIIPGHVNLGTFAEGTSRSNTGIECDAACCDTVFSKAANMVVDFMKTQVGDSYKKMLVDIKNGTRGSSVTDVFDEMMNHEDAKAIRAGHLWNIDDETNWVCCHANIAPGESCPIVENNPATGLSQGDINCDDDPETKAMLLQAAVSGKRWGGVLWPKTTQNQHQIVYCFASDVSAEARKGFEAAVDHVRTQVPCLTFKAVISKSCVNSFRGAVQECCSELPSIIVQSQKRPLAGCWSMIGMSSGSKKHRTSSQPINLDSGCEIMGIGAHEIGHALGLLHEMSRNDREMYLTINKHNINATMLGNFNNQSEAYTGIKFDFLSLMMYGAYTFSTNGEVTIMPRDKRLIPLMGQRMGFSELDILQIGEMYECVDTVKPATANKLLSEAYLTGKGFEEFKGICVDKEITGFIRDGSEENMPCEELKSYCRHTTRGQEIREICPVSCFVCIPNANNTQSITHRKSTKNFAGESFGFPGWIMMGFAFLLS